MRYDIVFAKEVNAHLEALSAREKARVFDAITTHLSYQPTTRTRNRKPMDPDKRFYIAPWELRIGELRVYYAVSETPQPIVVITAVGVKVRERLRIAGEDVDP